jgi:hypothetical protein
MAVFTACHPFVDRTDISCDCDAFSDEEIEELIDQASDLVAVLTGGKIAGQCTQTVRPVGDHACSPFAERPIRSHNSKQILLPGPNPTVTQIKIDGTVLASSEYVMVDDVYLTRVHGVWPSNKNPLLPDTDDNTFSVTFTVGFLPALAKMAVKELVCDWVKSDVRLGFNRALPHGARSANIAGVNIQLEQTVEEIRRRSILLPSLVRLLTVYAPDAGQPAVAYSPELENGWILHTVV